MSHLPVSSDFYTSRNTLGWLFTTLLSDANAILSFETLRMLFLCRKAGFVTFPSDARSLFREVYFSLYFDFLSFSSSGSVLPI
jgi:hypothetical protein